MPPKRQAIVTISREEMWMIVRKHYDISKDYKLIDAQFDFPTDKFKFKLLHQSFPEHKDGELIIHRELTDLKKEESPPPNAWHNPL